MIDTTGDENDNSSSFSLINFALLNQSSPWPDAGIKSGLGWNLPWRSLNHSAREHGQDLSPVTMTSLTNCRMWSREGFCLLFQNWETSAGISKRSN